MAVNWSSNVNKNIYNMDIGTTDNLLTVEFECGKKRTMMKNSKGRKTFKFSIALWTRTEEVAFWNWYDQTLHSGAEAFYFTDLLTQSGTKEYILTSTPSCGAGSYPKELKLECEEK